MIWYKYRSAESAEKKLPKPVYIGLAVIYLLIILLFGLFSSTLFSSIKDGSESVLKMYTREIETK